MRVARIFALALIAAIAVACGQADAALDGSLEADLKAAESAAIEMAPVNGGRDVVSSIELVGGPKPSTSRRAQAPAPRKAVAAEDDAAEEVPEIAVVPAPMGVPDTTAAKPIPTAKPERRGPYKSVGEIIRNAPFPINPLT